MTKQQIQLAPNLTLPIDLVTMTIGLIGKKGSGKSYTAMRVFEIFYGCGVQCVAIDPVGLWYGLRLNATGKSPSSITCPIFGGERADVPLQEQSGKIVAQFLQKTGSSAILDVSGFSKAKRKQFVADFIETFYHMQKTRRTACHIFFDEAQLFAPQNPGEGEQRMLGAVEDLVRLGRNFGIGNTLISQRPQSINKEVLNQAEPLILFQLTGAHERKAIADWVTYNGLSTSRLLNDLPTLTPGNGLFWSPSWVNKFEPLRVSKRETYDSTSTPVVGELQKPVTVAKVDLGNLTEEMQKMVQEVEASDPKKLKLEVASLKQQLALAQKGVPEAEVNRRIAEALKARPAAVLSSTPDRGERILADLRKLMEKHTPAAGVSQPARPLPPAAAPAAPVRHVPQSLKLVTGSLPSPEQRILNALAWWESTGAPAPYSRVQVAFLAGYSPTSTGFTNPLSSLNVKALVQYGKGTVTLTDAGRRLAEPVTRAATQEELHAAILNKLSNPQARILMPLLRVYPDDMGREELARQAGYSVTSTGFTNPLSSLNVLSLVTKPRAGYVRAADFLFLGGKA